MGVEKAWRGRERSELTPAQGEPVKLLKSVKSIKCLNRYA